MYDPSLHIAKLCCRHICLAKCHLQKEKYTCKKEINPIYICNLCRVYSKHIKYLYQCPHCNMTKCIHHYIRHQKYTKQSLLYEVFQNEIRIFKPCQNEWRYHSMKLDTKINNWASSISVCENIYISGGFPNYNGCFAFSYIGFNFRTTASMKIQKYGHSLCAMDGLIYSIGGKNTHYCLNTFECYRIKSNSWEELESLSTPRSNCVAFIWDKCIYALQGTKEYKVFNYSAEKYIKGKGWVNVIMKNVENISYYLFPIVQRNSILLLKDNSTENASNLNTKVYSVCIKNNEIVWDITHSLPFCSFMQPIRRGGMFGENSFYLLTGQQYLFSSKTNDSNWKMLRQIKIMPKQSH